MLGGSSDKAHLEAVLDTVLDGLIAIDAAGRVQSFNPAATRIFGYQRDDVIGRHIGMLLPAFEPHICADALKRHLMVEDQACTSVAREVTAR
ncbi:MAG: PAS domain S-box protein, partial [Pseudomonadota bacterium]